jgi:hypothetical protein
VRWAVKRTEVVVMRTVTSWIILAGAVALAAACSASPTDRLPNNNSGSGAQGGNGAVGGSIGVGGTGAFGAVGAFAGTSGLDDDAGCDGISEGAENNKQPSDIIIAVDQSGSMDLETAWVAQQLNDFSRQILSSGIDVHVVLIAGVSSGNAVCIDPPLGSGGCPAQDSNPPTYTHVNQEVASHDALDLIISTYPQYSQVLRPQATKHVLVITDDTPAAMSTAQFDAALKALDPMWQGYTFHGIVAPMDGVNACLSGNPCCGVAAFPGGNYSDYPQLIQQTQGVFGDLCLQDFQPVWSALSTAVITGSALACEWVIPDPPAGETFDPALVNVTYTGAGQQRKLGHINDPSECAQFRDAWYYDSNDDPTKVLVCQELCQEIQSGQAQRMDIVFGCASVPPVPK